MWKAIFTLFCSCQIVPLEFGAGREDGGYKDRSLPFLRFSFIPLFVCVCTMGQELSSFGM